jgi:hypothetical protein
MADFEDILKIANTKGKTEAKAVLKVLNESNRGCDNCPAKKFWKHGVKPINSKVKGKKIFIVSLRILVRQRTGKAKSYLVMRVSSSGNMLMLLA